MSSSPQFGVEVFAKRLDVLRRLEASLAESETAILRMEVAGMVRFAEQQEELCRVWRELDDRIRREAASREVEAAPVLLERWHLLRQETERVEGELRQRNRIQAALLKRMRRSMAYLESLRRDPTQTYSVARALTDRVGAAGTEG